MFAGFAKVSYGRQRVLVVHESRTRSPVAERSRNENGDRRFSPAPPPPKKDEKGGRYPYGASFARACSGLFGRRPVTHGCVYEVFITSEEHHEEIEIEREGGGEMPPLLILLHLASQPGLDVQMD